MPYESQVWKEEPLQIPPVAASRLAHCSLMDIRYNLYVSVGMINVRSHLNSRFHSNQSQTDNKKFWEELICLLSLHKLTVNNLVAMFTM
jgi:hypothetical protein